MSATWLGLAQAIAYPLVGALLYRWGWGSGRRDRDDDGAA